MKIQKDPQRLLDTSLRFDTLLPNGHSSICTLPPSILSSFASEQGGNAGNGTISGKAPGPTPGPSPIATPEVQDTKKKDASNESVTTGKNEQVRQPPGSSARSSEALVHDPSVAMRKAALAKAVGLHKPSKAQLEEIRKAIHDGKKEEAIKLTIKYYNIDTSGAHEVKYVGPKKDDAAGAADQKEKEYKEIGTGTHNRNGRISIEICDESFQFNGKDSPEWLATAISHESFHAKNHFSPDKPVIVKNSPDSAGAKKPQMSQQDIAEEIQAYAYEQKEAGKIGLTPDMLTEIQSRQNKLYAQLTDENREIISPILRGQKPWPQPKSHP